MNIRPKFSRVFLTTAICSTLALPVGLNAAMAQDANQEAEEIEEVVVTGSRIARSNLTTPTPVSAVSDEDMKLSGNQDMTETLQENPALLSSVNNEQAGANIGASFLNLRSWVLSVH